MKPETIAEPAAQRARILKLTVFQTWLACVGGIIAIGTTAAAIAHGWIGLPEKVKEIHDQQVVIEQKQAPLMVLTNRVDAMEASQKLLWGKVSAQNDLLMRIDQKLNDMDERQKETAQDVKALRH